MNNRQAGRRRGRGGQRSQNNPGRNDGNRIDNRARGNASQLLEKYKNLARDAQMQGDRVNTEYYLQFADHYFRVLNENRVRQEENSRRNRDDSDDEDGNDVEADADTQDEAPRRERRNGKQNGHANGKANGHAASQGDEGDSDGDEAQAEEAPKPRRRGRPRREAEESASAEQPAAIDANVLPPALSPDEGEAKPRRRRTAKKAEGESDASAA